MSRPRLLVMSEAIEKLVRPPETEFDIVRLEGVGDRDAFLRQHGAGIAAALTSGVERFDQARFDLLPDLRLIATITAGVSGIDLVAAAARGIAVTNAGDLNAGDVADFAVTLMLAHAREVVANDRWVREDRWPEARRRPARSIATHRVGIVGLGHIGQAIAARLAPFGCEIAWWGPRPKPEAPWPRFDSLDELAAWATILIVAARGDDSTRGLATCLCGLAGTFPILLLGRMGVGVGESALTPAAHSLITEQFPRERLSTALATYSLGSVIGTGIATILGGQLVHLIAEGNPAVVPVIGTVQPWQMVFLAVGIPTVILAPLALLVKERIDRGRKSVETQGAGMSIAAFFAFCMKNPRLFFGLPIAFGMLNIITNSLLSWVPTFMQRTYGWNIANIGLAWGTEHIIAGAIGQIGGAMLVDRLYARGVADAHVRYQWVGVLIGVPATIIGLLSGNPWIFLGTMAIYSVLCYPFLGYAVAALQLHTPSHLRGRMSAWFYAVITVIGSLIGAPITAFITQSVFVDKAKIGLSMVTVMAIFAPLVVLMLMWVGSNLRATHASRGQ